ncbi:MAG: hypothetical protein ACOWWM_03935 [Desulfobacterales bacterium]
MTRTDVDWTMEARAPGKASGLRRQRMRTLLIDTSSAILLYKTGLIGTAADAWRLLAVPAVVEELMVDGQPGTPEFGGMLAAGRLGAIGTPTRKSPRIPELERLGAGERDTIMAFLNGSGSFILIDDGPAAGYCRSRSIPYINALLVPRILALAGIHVPAGWPVAMTAVDRAGRYSDAIRDHARHCPDRWLEPFLP